MASSLGFKNSISKNERGPSTPIHDSIGAIETIKENIRNIEVCVSGYDTAWVAMVRSLESDGKTPQFPQCIDWILMNQQADGSWRSHGRNFGSRKDDLAATLACVIALQQWNIGESMRDKGIHFIVSSWSAIDEDNYGPHNGFHVIFSGMIKILMNMGLKLPISRCEIDKIFQRRDVELQRASRSQCRGAETYLIFVAEGLDNFPEWEKLEKYQKKNGSILDSPSTTAATLDHHKNVKCLEYLNSLLKIYESHVPSRYSLDQTIQLRLVDLLENLGIGHYFSNEIEEILNKTHRLWLQNEESVASNFYTYAMAFRLLRNHSYGISPGSF